MSKTKSEKISLIEIAKTFLIIGTIGFGGGMAIVAMVQDYCVNKKKWLSLEEFLHGVTLGQIWGAFATNITIFVGYRVRGFMGAVVAVISFLAPSVLFVIILSALYMRFHNVPALQSALNGISPVVVALIIAAAYQMGKEKIKTIEPILLMLITIVLLVFLKAQVIAILLAAIVYGIIKVRFFDRGVNDSDLR